MDDKRSHYKDLEDFFWNSATLAFTVALAVYAFNVTNGVSGMSGFFWVFIAAAFFSAVSSFYYGVRVWLTPKDRRLDVLLANSTAITTEIQQLKLSIDNQLDKTTAKQLITAVQELTQELKKRNVTH